MQRLPKKEVNEIAKGIIQNQIFCSYMAPDNLIVNIFMPLALMSKEDLSKHDVENVGQIIGDMRDTFGMGVNGYPIFHSCRLIYKEDWKLILAKVRQMDKAMTKIMRNNKKTVEDYSI